MLTGQLLRLRRVRMTPGGGFILVSVVVRMCVPVAMVIMSVCMSMIVGMTVRMMRMRSPTQETQKGPALDPQESQPDQHDQSIADDLDDANGVAHSFCRCAQQCSSNADDSDGGESLENRRSERQHDATPPGLVIGNQIRRDHRLAVAGAGSMENSVKERDTEQRVRRAAVIF